jgi:hypothetical protein
MKTRIMMISFFALLCGGAAFADGTASSSSSSAKRENECVFSDQISGWNVLDSRHVIIWSPTYKQAYLVTLITPLQDTTVSMALAFVDKDHDGMICGRSSDGIAVPDTGIHTIPSTISGMHKVDAAELQQLSDKYKVNLVPKQKKAKSSASSVAMPATGEKPASAESKGS